MVKPIADFYRVVFPLSSLGLSADNNGAIFDVRYPFDDMKDSPAAQAGMRPGERLDIREMHCKHPLSDTCANIVSVMSDFGGVQYTLRHKQITLLVLPPHGGAPLLFHLRPAYAPLHWLSRIVLLADTVVAILFVGVAFNLVWTRPSTMTWGFFLYAIWFNPGSDYAFYSLLQYWTPAVLIEQVVESFVRGAAYAGLIAFALCFPGETVEARWRRLGAILPWLALTIAGLSLVSSLNLFGLPTETISRVLFFSLIPLDAIAILLLVLRLRHLPPQDEQRMRWAIAGCAIGLPAFLIAELSQSSGVPNALFGVTPTETVVELLYLFHGAIAYFVGTAIRRRRVVSVAIPLRRGAILAMLTFVLGVPIVYLHDLFSRYGGQINEAYQLPEWIWLLLVSPVILIVLTELHHHAVHLTERAFNRRYYRARDSLAAAGQKILHLNNFGEIDRMLAEAPTQGLRLSSAAVFREIDGALHRTGPAIGWSDTTLATLDPALDALPLTCLETGMPQRLPRGSWHRPGLPADEQVPCLAVPILGGASETTAIVLFGPHVTGTDINRDEQDLLSEFAERAALGYDRIEFAILRQELQALRLGLKPTG